MVSKKVIQGLDTFFGFQIAKRHLKFIYWRENLWLKLNVTRAPVMAEEQEKDIKIGQEGQISFFRFSYALKNKKE